MSALKNMKETSDEASASSSKIDSTAKSNVTSTSKAVSTTDGVDFTDEQQKKIDELSSSSMSQSQKETAFAAIMSDNYSNDNATETEFTVTNTDGTTKTYKNSSADDDTKTDVSEMTTLEKHKLTGSFSDKVYDTFDSDAKKGDTKNVCGGTITYNGTGMSQCGITPEHMIGGQNVHYEGVLGSFDYNTSDYALTYYTSTENGNQINVPVLRYIGGSSKYADKTKANDGYYIKIPDGIKQCDYMFADSDVTSVPELPDSITSAHCMFKSCSQLTGASASELGTDGKMKYPESLEDISWMFADDSNMTDFFSTIGANTLDARCAAQDCSSMGLVYESDEKDSTWNKVCDKTWSVLQGSGESGSEKRKQNKSGSVVEGKNKFTMPDFSKARWLTNTYCDNMFDGMNCDALKKVKESDGVSCNSEDGSISGVSKWSLESDGVDGSVFSRVNDGTYDANKQAKLTAAAQKYKLYKLIDPSAKGTTGLSAQTDGTASTGVQLTDDGVKADDSTWSTLRQNTLGNASSTSDLGGLLDKGLAFLGTYGISSGIIKATTKSKWASLLGGLAIATVPQVVGTANKISPLLTSIAGFVGTDSKFGQFLTKMSSKLTESNVSSDTQVQALDIEDAFDDQKTASLTLAKTQVGSLSASDIIGSSSSASMNGAYISMTANMKANGKNLASDGNLITIALTDEDELDASLNDCLMSTASDGLQSNLESSAKSDGGKLSDANKKKYSQYYLNLMQNISAYSTGASDEINTKYISDADNRAKAMNGLGKVMRNTSKSVYESMREIQTKYNLFSQDQLEELDAYAPEGMPKFSEYKAGQDVTPTDSDTYSDALAADKQSIKDKIAQGLSDSDVSKAYSDLYEKDYGYLMDEAKDHDVELSEDKAESKDSDSKSDDSNTDTANTESSSSSSRDGVAISESTDDQDQAEAGA